MAKLALLVLAVTVFGAQALDNGLARTPPMGWLSWERFECSTDCKDHPDQCVSENLYKAQADKMVSDGYRDAGYVYVNIDDCWPLKQRDSQGRLVPDPERFPSGMKALADYMHTRGLKLGIYSCMGYNTCQGYPGSMFYMEQDAQTFAEWGIDSLKLDSCYSTLDELPIGYPTMGFYLNKTGRPILFSCSWPASITRLGKIPPYPEIAKACNLWRNYADILDTYDSVSGIVNWFGNDEGNFSSVAGPGNWNDPDMLIIGDFGLSYDQQRLQMAIWAILAAPLYMSNDLRNINPASRDLLLNKRVIAINQDPLGIAGKRVSKFGEAEIWMRPISPAGNAAIAVVNPAHSGSPVTVQWTLDSLGFTGSRYNVTEVFDGKPVGTFSVKDTIKVPVNPSGVYLVVVELLNGSR